MRNIAIFTIGVILYVIVGEPVGLDGQDDHMGGFRSIMEDEGDFPRDYCMATA